MRDCADGLQLRTRPPAGLAVAAAVNEARAEGALGATFALEALRHAGKAPHNASESTCVDVEVRPAHRGAITLHKASLRVCGVTISKSWTLGFLRRPECRRSVPVLGGLYCPHDRKLVSSANAVLKWRPCMPECHSVSATTGARWQSARDGGERSRSASRVSNALRSPSPPRRSVYSAFRVSVTSSPAVLVQEHWQHEAVKAGS